MAEKDTQYHTDHSSNTKTILSQTYKSKGYNCDNQVKARFCHLIFLLLYKLTNKKAAPQPPVLFFVS
jgi:hypothetical protein